MPTVKVVLDTNVIVSGLAYPASIPGQILGAWREGKIDLVLSEYILEETERVLPRLPRVNLSGAEIRDLIDGFALLAEIVPPSEHHEPALRDIADQQVLGTLLASGASCLVTGDEDLLALGHKYTILAPSEFWAQHSGQQG